MASYYKLVENEDDLKTFFEAGMLWYKYNTVADSPRSYIPEHVRSLEQLLWEWNERAHCPSPWESYILIENDAEEATCPSP